MKIYYGDETKHALVNFPFSIHRMQLELIYAITQVKQAAAQANLKAGHIDEQRAEAIVQVGSEILEGKYDDQFVTPALQGGAGTSVNMNVNEVIANRATEILSQKNLDLSVHPLDDVNRSQSTNDVNPSGLKIACIHLTQKLLKSLDVLVASFHKKSEEFSDVIKLGRTHLQDAVPTTLGEEFASYAAIIQTDQGRIAEVLPYFYFLNLGGTAIGNGINASKEYQKYVYEYLQEVTGLFLKPAKNLMSLTSSQSDFVMLSGAITNLMVDLSKIASDIRLMSSGPRGGFGEIQLPPLQKGSTIMPGKVNPVIPEAINQTYYMVSGHNLTVHQVAQGSQLELGIMFPILADYLISSLKQIQEVIVVFDEKCISGLQANKKRCRELLEHSTAYATLLTPVLGYDMISDLVKETIETGRSFKDVVLEKTSITQAEFSRLSDATI